MISKFLTSVLFFSLLISCGQLNIQNSCDCELEKSALIEMEAELSRLKDLKSFPIKISKNTIFFIFMVGILGCLDTLGMFARLKEVIRIGSRCCFGELFGSYSSKMSYNLDFIYIFQKNLLSPLRM